MGEGVLSVSGRALGRIAEVTGTPVYVYNAQAIRSRHEALRSAIAGVPHRIHYSVKANSSLAILDLVRREGMGADIVSAGELHRALQAGFQGSDIVFSGVGKRTDELARAVAAGVGLINLESEGEFEALAGLVRNESGSVGVGIRINPDVTTETHPYTQTGKSGMKFGVPLDQVMALVRRIATVRGMELRSVGMHIGSQISQTDPYRRGAARLAELVELARQEGVATLESVDVGGGLAIDYGQGQGMDASMFATAVLPLAQATGLTLLVEPGRFLVGNAGLLLTRVLYHKRSGGREILVTDAGMNDLLRPSLYQAHHEVAVVDSDMVAFGPMRPAVGAAPAVPMDIVGPNCETGDFLALARPLPPVGPGSLLAVLDAGAYGFGMSSNYNSRPRAAEVLMDGGRFGVIRAREAPEDLVRGETATPAWEVL